MEFVNAGYFGIAILGLVMGSFAGATVWRIRARQLIQDKKTGEPIEDKTELKRLKPLANTTLANDRSRCLHCGHELSVRDLIPLVSWVSTKGKCRYCRKKIGAFEPLIELGTMALFLGYYHWWVMQDVGGASGGFLLLGGLIAAVLFMILFAYDAKWFLLPDVVMVPLIALGLAYTSLSAVFTSNPLAVVVNATASVAILGGLYLVLWLVSKGRWVGFGDVKLGVALGLFLLDWRLAILTLFLANLIGTLVVLPGLLTGKLTRQSQVPFGPLLIIGFFISFFFGHMMICGYEGFSNWLSQMLLML